MIHDLHSYVEYMCKEWKNTSNIQQIAGQTSCTIAPKRNQNKRYTGRPFLMFNYLLHKHDTD